VDLAYSPLKHNEDSVNDAASSLIQVQVYDIHVFLLFKKTECQKLLYTLDGVSVFAVKMSPSFTDN